MKLNLNDVMKYNSIYRKSRFDNPYVYGFTVAIVSKLLNTGVDKVKSAWKRNETIQKKVDTSIPKSLSQSENTKPFLTIIDNENVDFMHFQEDSMTDEEVQTWKYLIASLGSEVLQASVTSSAFKGLVKCDIPLKDLCRVKNNPNAMRGYVRIDGKISKQAVFTKAGFSSVAPSLIFQCFSLVTAQYYQHIIAEKLTSIEHKIDIILQHIDAADRSTLKASYKQLIDLIRKTKYDEADKINATSQVVSIDNVREKYIDLIKKVDIPSLKINRRMTTKKESRAKTQKLEHSCYLKNLDMVINAEYLYNVALAVSMKIAKYLNNEEDYKNYIERFNVDFWTNYVDQFNAIRHDVIKYLELEAEDSSLNKESISEMKEQWLKEFNKIEENAQSSQDRLDYRMVQYISFQEDGTLRKFIPIPEGHS